jgi:hypothetical protein
MRKEFKKLSSEVDGMKPTAKMQKILSKGNSYHVSMVHFLTNCPRFFKYRANIKDNYSTDYHAKVKADRRPFR